MAQWFAVVAMTGVFAWLAALATAEAQCPTPGTVSTACSTESDCAKIAAPSVSGSAGNTVSIPLTFTQGPNDNQSGKGFDEVAAIAFTLGVPGTGDAAPLTFDCTDGNLNPDAVTIGGSLTNFTAVVENAQCTNRNHCLCPDTTAGQTLDNYVNVVVYGPSSLPSTGPVTIPVLPSGTLVTLKMRLAAGATGSIPLKFFSALDTSKPQFAANLSIGDPAACDVSANAQGRSNVVFGSGSVMVGPNGCVGDCDASHSVSISELVTGVNIALGSAQLSSCPAFDCQGNGTVPINCLIQAVNNALGTCP